MHNRAHLTSYGPYYYLLLAIPLLFAIAGCNKTPPTPVATGRPTPSTRPSPLPSPTPIPSPATTVAPTPHSSLIPLSVSGPWLIYATRERSCPEWTLSVANWDGSGYRPLDLPCTPEHTPGLASPRGGYAALLLRETADLQLRIVKLPQGVVVRTISLYSPEAKEALANWNHQEYESILWGIAMGAGNPAWSPTGRFLAFNAALDQLNVDIYVYDAERDTLQRLTSAPHVESVKAWSPDGKWIIYEEASTYTSEGLWFDKLSAITIDGESDHELYLTDSFDEAIVGWTTDHTFVVESTHFEGPSDNLREVDVETDYIRVLYAGPFYSADLAPQTGTCILNMRRLPWWTPAIEEGIYRLTPENDLLLVLSGSYWTTSWVPQIEQFVVTDEENNILTFSPEGKVGLRLPWRGLKASPDGQWLLLWGPANAERTDAVLWSASGEQVRSIGRVGQIVWLPDSTGFYRSASGILDLHMANEQWEAKVISEHIADYAILFIVHP